MLCFIGYFCVSSFLIYHATLDGNESSEQSGAVGDEISGIVNENKGDQTVLVEPEELLITNKINSAFVGKTHQIRCSLLPQNATYKSLIYSSSNKEVATVSTTGNISFLKEGKTIIEVKNKDFPSILDSMEIEVKYIDLINYDTLITYKQKEVEKDDEGIYCLEQYEKYLITHSFNPIDASDKKVSYFYDKEYLVIANGQIIANKPTNNPVDITIKCNDIENTIKITIKEKNIEIIDLENYSIQNSKINMTVNQVISLSSNPFKASFTPTNATDKELIYKSLNPDIIIIEGRNIKALSTGVATIEITSHDGNIINKAQIEVKNIIELDQEKPFIIEQEYLEFNEKDNSYHIRNGFSGSIKCNFTDASTFTTATFESSSEKILLVGNDGIFNPIKTGKATITITIDDGYLEKNTHTINFVVEGKPFIENMSEFYYIIRKSIGHFGAFFVLGIMGTFGFLLRFDKKKWLFSIPLTLGLGLGVAALTEYIQTFVPGRYGCVEDVILDFEGYVTGFVLISTFIFVIYLINFIKEKKERSH